MNAGTISYAQEKVASVRKLHRTSLPIPHAGGIYPPKQLTQILGGLLSFESDWNPAFGKPLEAALANADNDNRLDLGCIASQGMFEYQMGSGYVFRPGGKPATALLLELIARLQTMATVPMIDVRAYAQWLAK